ncbi:hypothetical protein F5J12DRAFT_906187 [Pisolithus orientalis]|uniref:uncharacterized protein n=1 Tax=Pisolithus orientalis TaxID=936130 RepID=UPI0022247D0B|nr:uncharacterized protein F5J12DRAFT_906187 [Pisolithus orientalis]KAI6003174.1 hypothetical protein F5J12DRAFT_906187 [Pisolithus orientalis]
MDPESPKDAAIFTCLMIVFYCVAHLGEFTVPAITQFDPQNHITRAHFHIPWTKMSPTGEDMQYPINTLKHHLHLNPAEGSAHLFTWKHLTSGLCPLLKMEVLNFCTPFDIVKTIGRWAGDSFTLYLCQHAMILAPYLNDTPALLKHFTRYTMPPVH